LVLFISRLNSSTRLGITTISLAFAVAQLMWGVIRPVAGAATDRYAPAKVLIAGLVVLAIDTAMTPFMRSAFGLIVALGLLSAVGAGAASFSVLIGAAAQHSPPIGEARQQASSMPADRSDDLLSLRSQMNSRGRPRRTKDQNASLSPCRRTSAVPATAITNYAKCTRAQRAPDVPPPHELRIVDTYR
jgi:hypothetical protein